MSRWIYEFCAFVLAATFGVAPATAQDKFVAEGYSQRRYDIMYNDFIIVGPKSDPAKIKGTKNAAATLSKIATGKLPFVSRRRQRHQ